MEQQKGENLWQYLLFALAISVRLLAFLFIVNDILQLVETQKKEGEQVAKWEKLDDCPLKTENYGDYGYIYQDTVWVAVTIFDNGDEMDTPCDTKAEAKQVIEEMK